MKSALDSRRGPIGLADLIRAFDGIEPSPADAQKIAGLLGLSSKPTATPALVRSRPPSGGALHPKERPWVGPGNAGPAVPALASAAPDLQIEAIASDAVLLPAWRYGRAPSPAGHYGGALVPLRRERGRAWPLESLLEPRSTRATLAAAVATQSQDGPLLVETIVEAITELRRLDPLPRLCTPTLRRGVQVVIERGDAMLPHLQDTKDVLRQLDGVVSGSLQVVSFDDDPTLVDFDDAPEGVRYEPPPRGTPVLAITRLGLGRGRPLRGWLRLAAALDRRGTRLIALVPFAAKRVPPEVSRRIAVIAWDRGTTIASVRRALARTQGPR